MEPENIPAVEETAAPVEPTVPESAPEAPVDSFDSATGEVAPAEAPVVEGESPEPVEAAAA